MSMNPTHIPSSEASNSAPLLKRNSVDVGWDYGVIVDPSNKDRLQCLLCGNQYTGGVSRMKRHIAQIRGDVASCTKASKEDILKCKKAIDDNAAKKKNKKKAAVEIREEVNIIGDESEGDEIENVAVGSKKRPYVLGPMDRYTSVDPDSSDTSGFKQTRQPNINDAVWKEKSHKVSQYLARWVYETGIPFHAIDNDSFKRFVEAVGLFGPGYQPPSQYQLREPLLKEEVERTKTLLKKQEEEWALTAFTIFVYAHHNTLAMMRKYKKRRDIVRPGVTRFATSFLTLQSLMEKKQELRAMFSSNAWGESKWAKSPKGKTAYATVMSQAFWNGVTLCLKVFGPLVMVLRLVDGDRKPSRGFVYGELTKAKEEIKAAYKQVETNYRPILDVIDGKAKGRLDSALHLTAYFLNPFYFFNNSTIQDDPIIMDGVLTCVEAFFPDDVNVQDEVINRELLKYKNKEGGFGRPLAAMGCATNNDTYDPVYVQFNAKLINNKKGKDVLRTKESTHAQGWLVEGGDEEVDPVSGLTWEVIGEASGVDEVLQPRRTTRNIGVRELHEEDFVSEDDTEEEIDEDFECESDGDEIMHGYGEEEDE
ncbi:hypothetical protein RHMOL_Rhmol05G0081800 [Rhododendron molle]|uniref:Uncharacterized protein n=1 Tax=Rhododendron molle TaxID=49168 RepID=A0ACC0NLX0_RHOML|nr:hypothetical protein RHMOL_Rhmol05G0081800 [Rhododendron molle]